MDATGGKVTWILDAYEKPLTDGVDRAKRKVSEIGDNADVVEQRTNKAFDSIAKVGIGALVAASVAAGAAIVSNIGNAVARVDTLNNAPKVLQNLGYSADGSAKAIQAIADGIKGLPTRLDAAVSGLVSIASASGLGIEEATKLTLAFNNMALAGGKGSADANRALVQFVQTLGRGKMGMQEFNTLSEVMPAQLAQVAKTLLGAEANSQSLRDAMSEGAVTMDDFVGAIVKLDTEGGEGFASFQQQARDATSGIGTGWENLNAAIIRGISSIITEIGAGDIATAMGNIGTAFENALTKVASFISWIKDNQDVIKAFGVAIGVVTVAFIGFRAAIVVQDLMNVINLARLGQGALVQYATSTKLAAAAQVILNAAMRANPIGIIITAVAALVAALVYFFSQTETGKKIWAGFVDFLAKAWEGIVTVFNAVIDSIVGFFQSAVATIQEVWGNVVGFFAGVWEGIKEVFTAIGGFFKGIWDGVVDIFNGFVNFLKEWGPSILAVILFPFSIILGFIIQNWESIVAFWNGLVEVVRTIFTAIGDVFTTIFTAIYNTIITIFTPVVGFFVMIFQAAWDGIVSVWNVVVSFFTAVWNGIVTVFTAVVGFFTAVFRAAWNGIVAIWNAVSGWFQGVWNKIVEIFTPVVNFFRDMFQAAWNAVVKVFSAVGGFFRGVWNTIVGIFTTVGTTVGNAIGDAFKTVINGVLKFAVGLINGFIDAINIAIGIMNAIPGVNIGKLGKLPVPQLATGGVVTDATLALIGEGSEPEAVIPLSKLDAMLNNSGEQNYGGAAREITINQTNEVYTELDFDQVNRNLTWELNKI